jgi:hypothetical protein
LKGAGVVKSLCGFACGPGVIHAQKVGIKYKKPPFGLNPAPGAPRFCLFVFAFDECGILN